MQRQRNLSFFGSSVVDWRGWGCCWELRLDAVLFEYSGKKLFSFITFDFFASVDHFQMAIGNLVYVTFQSWAWWFFIKSVFLFQKSASRVHFKLQIPWNEKTVNGFGLIAVEKSCRTRDNLKNSLIMGVLLSEYNIDEIPYRAKQSRK